MRRIWETERQCIVIILASKVAAKGADIGIVTNTANVRQEKSGRKIRFT